MEKRVFRAFMDNNVVQKMVIFADAFNLNIERWKPENSEEHPYRINFYSGGLVAGYVDVVMERIGSYDYVNTDIPFVMFTPFGKITGSFSTYFSLFKFKVENRKDSSLSINGLFKVVSPNRPFNQEYFIGAYLSLEDEENNRLKVCFNNTANNYAYEIEKSSEKSYEDVRLHYGGTNASIEHFDYPVFNFRRDLTWVNLESRQRQNIVPVSFAFFGNDPYKKDITLEEPVVSFRKMEKIDYRDIGSEIDAHDPRMREFINEVREDLTFLANGTTPVSLYDRFARLCFYRKKDKLKLDFSGASEGEIAINRSLIKYMDSYQHKRP